MDYEKKYKAALERFKHFKETYCTYGEMNFGDVLYDRTGKAQEELDSIFPELRESDGEDERMIKRIKQAITGYHPNRTTEEDSRMLAYLDEVLAEKEQKPAEWNKKPCLTCDEYNKGYKQGYTEGCTAGYNKAMLEVEQEEQKPAEGKYYSSPDCGTTAGVWSEEDEHRRKDAIYFLECAMGHYADTSEIENTIAWLKSLPLNIKKKNEDVAKLCSTEWSEEDEKMIQSIVLELQRLIDFSPNSPGFEIRVRKEQNWLKSLRPQPKWKPSEEQMNSLNYGIYVLEEEGYDASASEIKELYEQLKKLMEEEQ